MPSGFKFLIPVIIYNIAVPLIAIFRQHKVWQSLWPFVFSLSIFQLFPDIWLASKLQVLVFPEDGLIKIGNVSAYMAGLWFIPLFIMTYLGEWARVHLHKGLDILVATLSGFLIFLIAEATLWMLGSWYPKDVIMWGKIAVYVLPAELILCLCTYQAYQLVKNSAVLVKIWAAFCVMLIYSGALNFFFYLIER